MKILIISNLFPPYVVGGYEILCGEVADALKNMGHDVYVLTSNFGTDQKSQNDDTVNRNLKLSISENIYTPPNLTQLERERLATENISETKCVIDLFDPEVVFVWNLFFFEKEYVKFVNGLDRKLFYLLTDNWMISIYNPVFLADYFSRNVFGSPRGCFFQNLKKYYNSILNKNKPTLFGGTAIFPSKFVKNLYSKSGSNFRNSFIINHGVKQLVGNQCRSQRNITDQQVIKLLFAGRVTAIKGLEVLIKSFPALKSKFSNKDFQLTVIGDQSDIAYMDNISSLIKNLELEARILFMPPVSEEGLFEVFNTHDIYMFPSLYEPYSLTLIHAMQAGIPTVASAIGGNVELIKHGVNGYLFDIYKPEGIVNSISELLKSDKAYNKISNNSVISSAHLTRDNMMMQIQKVLQGA